MMLRLPSPHRPWCSKCSILLHWFQIKQALRSDVSLGSEDANRGSRWRREAVSTPAMSPNNGRRRYRCKTHPRRLLFRCGDDAVHLHSNLLDEVLIDALKRSGKAYLFIVPHPRKTHERYSPRRLNGSHRVQRLEEVEGGEGEEGGKILIKDACDLSTCCARLLRLVPPPRL